MEEGEINNQSYQEAMNPKWLVGDQNALSQFGVDTRAIVFSDSAGKITKVPFRTFESVDNSVTGLVTARVKDGTIIEARDSGGHLNVVKITKRSSTKSGTTQTVRSFEASGE